MSSLALMALLATAGLNVSQLPRETPPPPIISEERSGSDAPPPSVRLYAPADEPARDDMVLRWNQIALDAIRADRSPPPLAARNLAMMHVAVFDAVNAILAKYEPYRVEASALPGASPEAAAAAAAHRVLVALYPRQGRALDGALRLSLAEVPAGRARDDGVELGLFVAVRILAWRADDGADRPGEYLPRPLVGQWRPTPTLFRPALLPGWGRVEPFAIRKGTQLRPPGPPALDSPAYTKAFHEVQRLGRKHGSARNPEQTLIAHFWADGDGTVTPPGHWNVLAQAVARKRGNSLLENARLFALLNISLSDAGVLCWVLKFTYELWRPVTAIVRAAEDGNPDTAPDPDWTPLLETPPFPSYTSGHSSFSGAAAAVLAHCFGADAVSFTATSEGVPGAVRSFRSFWQAAEEAGQSRIYGGIHYQFDNQDGLAVGRHLGRYVCRHFLRPREAMAGQEAQGRDSFYRPLPRR